MRKFGFERSQARRARRWRAGSALSLLASVVVVGCSGSPDSPSPAQVDPSAIAPSLAPQTAAPNNSTPTANWQASVGARITAGEYKIRSEGSALSAFNRAQSMRTRWTANGVELRLNHATSDANQASPNARLQALRTGASNPTAALAAATASGTANEAEPTIRLRTVGLARAEQWIATAQGADFSPGSCRKDKAVDEFGECMRRAESAQSAWREWWENRADGLEQGFDVPARPLAEQTGAPLRIEIALDGASAAISDDGQAAVLTAGSGEVLRYGQLAARDSGGNALPIRLTGRLGGLALEVDDSAATYPIEIDPLVASSWNANGNQTNESFGTSVASAGDVNGDGYADVIVGAPYYTGTNNAEGTAFLYLGSSNGLPNAAVSWSVLGGRASANLGGSVAAAGDVNGDGYGDILLGGTGYGIEGGGGLLLFYGNAKGLPKTQPDWQISAAAGSALGISVASAGDVNGDGYGDFIAGAPYMQPGGQAFVWYGSATGPSSTHTTIQSAVANAAFGYSVASAGDVNGDGLSDVIIGAPYYQVGGNSVGQISVYHGATGGINPAAANYTTTGTASSVFGYSVASAGDVNGDNYSDVVVGSPNYSNGQPEEGLVQVYFGGANGIAGSPWATESNSSGAELGFSVASAGDVNADGFGDIVVGAPFGTLYTANEGTATIYFGSTSRSLVASNTGTFGGGQANAEFGISVACAGDVDGDGRSDVIVGAPAYSGAFTQAGKAFLFTGNGPVGYANPAQPQILGSQANALIGVVGAAGDVNGDGYGDVIAVSPGYTSGTLTNEGVAMVYLGGPGGTGTTPIWSAGSLVSNASPYTAASAGDVNGDGYADVITCSPTNSNNTGFARLYAGNANGVSSTSSWTVSGQAGSDFGYRCVGVGDVNGDGYGDVVVGAPTYTNGQTYEGALYVYLGGANGLSTTATVIEANVAGAEIGASLGSAGDVNHDGYADVIVGAPYYTNVESSEGEALVYLGSASGLGLTAGWRLESNTAGAYFGYSVAGAGDINGDGYDDIVVGAPVYSSENGAAVVYYGSASGPVNGTQLFNSGWAFQGFGTGLFGFSVGSGGDMNGDGYADLLVGGPYYTSNAGVVIGFNGGPSGVGGADIFQVGASNAYQGYCVGSTDVNGDGYSDAIVSAEQYSGALASQGAAFIYLGNGSDSSASGFGIRPQSRRLNTTTPIVTGDKSFNSTGFDAVLRAAHGPMGRTRVKLQVEAKAFNTAFNGTTGVVTGAWTATSNNPTLAQNLTSTIFGSIGTLPHWRARLIYDPSRLPWFGRSHWFYGGDIGRSRDVVARIAQ